jgi:mono/diheme cytochrome c family protein
MHERRRSIGYRSWSVVAVGIVGMISFLSAMRLPAWAASVEENYTKHCSPCHGQNGSGNGPAAKVLNKHPGDFTNCDVMRAYKREFLVKIIAEGGTAVGRSSQMPASAKKLSPEEIEGLVDHIATGFCKGD